MSSNANAMRKETTDGKGSPSRPSPGKSYAQAASSATKGRNVTANDGGQKIPAKPLPNDKGVSDIMVTPDSNKGRGVHNPYRTKRSGRSISERMESVPQLTKLVGEYMGVITDQDNQANDEKWYAHWMI